VHHQQLDVSDGDAFAAYAPAVADHFGVVHQVFNNAGTSRSRSVLDLTGGDYQRVFGVNLWGVIYGTKAFLPYLIASGDGHVVNVSSVNGFMAYPTLSAYVTSKFAVRGFTEALRTEMLAGGVPVRVTVVHPGGVRTNITENTLALARADGIPISAEDERRAREYHRRFLRLSPDAAAKTILDGVTAGKGRILVGTDAKIIDMIVRLLPGVYPRIIAWSTTKGAR
jgi:NAD(P)-dependent dehydrogenase (short-subunit alcohol dehydrogenase family)